MCRRLHSHAWIRYTKCAGVASMYRSRDTPHGMYSEWVRPATRIPSPGSTRDTNAPVRASLEDLPRKRPTTNRTRSQALRPKHRTMQVSACGKRIRVVPVDCGTNANMESTDASRDV